MRCGPLSSLLLPLAGARREDSRPFMVDAELKRFRKKVDAWARMQEARGARQRLSAAVTTRARGTDLFKKGDIEAALKQGQEAGRRPGPLPDILELSADGEVRPRRLRQPFLPPTTRHTCTVRASSRARPP